MSLLTENKKKEGGGCGRVIVGGAGAVTCHGLESLKASSKGKKDAIAGEDTD